ncbi:MAG: motility associated factor glycosyltransferase family protein [Deltaproteobacteria bacterium]|nr:motility associated factor glycosyltransferase family protein [Deltaproteobacteria bacterium]
MFEKASSKIVFGYEKIGKLLEKTPALPVIGGPLEAPPPSDASIVWVVDRISNILQRICIQIKNNPNLKRLLVLTTDASEMAALVKSEPYQFLFEHPALKIAVIDPNEPPDLTVYRNIFEPSSWDLKNETSFFYSFRPEFEGQQEWLAQVRSIYFTITALHRDGLGSDFCTEDSFLGFKNGMQNIPLMLKTPDIRNWKGLGKGRPVFLVGAGPSVRSQLEFLRSVQDCAIIIAADTMLKPLARAGISAHLLASMERAPEIIDLLNDTNDHSKSFLVASSVLDPKCFSDFRGPHTIYASGLPFSEWFPFERLRLGSGHSCMGLAMTLATYLESSQVYLMGIDLCWSEEGQSHMSDVPYLQKQFYITQNKKLFENSFVTKNSQGKTVRTNQFWTAFKQQFEFWAKRNPGKIFNLSPSGLSIAGAAPLSLDEVKINSTPFDFHAELSTNISYDRTKNVLRETKLFLEKLDFALPKISQICEQIKSATASEILQILESQSFYFGLLHPILQGSAFNLNGSDKDATEASRKFILKILPQIRDVYLKTRDELKNLLKDQAENKFELY